RDHGVEVRPVDINHSAWDCTLEGPALRLGFRLVKGLPLARAEAVVAARQEQPFRSVADFVRRSGVGRALATRLAVADAFRSLGLGRRGALWHALCGWQELPLFVGLEEDGVTPPLGEMPLNEEVITDYDSVGLSLKAHPIEPVRADLK